MSQPLVDALCRIRDRIQEIDSAAHGHRHPDPGKMMDLLGEVVKESANDWVLLDDVVIALEKAEEREGITA